MLIMFMVLTGITFLDVSCATDRVRIYVSAALATLFTLTSLLVWLVQNGRI